jgi:hypothetical protein
MRSSTTEITGSSEVSRFEAALGIALLAVSFVIMAAGVYDAVASLETALYALELGL